MMLDRENKHRDQRQDGNRNRWKNSLMGRTMALHVCKKYRCVFWPYSTRQNSAAFIGNFFNFNFNNSHLMRVLSGLLFDVIVWKPNARLQIATVCVNLRENYSAILRVIHSSPQVSNFLKIWKKYCKREHIFKRRRARKVKEVHELDTRYGDCSTFDAQPARLNQETHMTILIFYFSSRLKTYTVKSIPIFTNFEIIQMNIIELTVRKFKATACFIYSCTMKWRQGGYFHNCKLGLSPRRYRSKLNTLSCSSYHFRVFAFC